MSTDLAVREQTAPVLSNDQLKYIANTEFVPKALRGNLPAIMACVATGRELGIGDMTALREIHIIDGRPAFSAGLQTRLVREKGHSLSGEVSDEKATARGRRSDTGDEMTVTWTREMAATAGLAGKRNWQQYPSAMLWSRAVSQLCRMLFADVFKGTNATPEELGDFDGEDATVDAEFVDEPGPVDTFGEAWNQASGEEPQGDAGVGRTAALAGAQAPNVTADPVDAAAPASTPVINEAQLKRLHTIASKHGVPKDEAKRIVLEVAGVESSKLIPRDRYEAVCTVLQAYEPVSQFQAPAGAA